MELSVRKVSTLLRLCGTTKYDISLRAGLVVKNKRLIIDIHDTSFTDFELKHLLTDNLQKSSGTAKAIKSTTAPSGVAWEETFDNIPTNAVDEARKAWSKY